MNPCVHHNTIYYSQDMRTTEMSIHRGVDTDARICNGISPSLEKSEIMAFAATRMDLEIVILSEISQRKRNTV